MYTENYKTLMKKIEDNITKWRDTPCFWVGRINVVKMTILPNTIYRMSDPYQITNDISHRTRTKNLTFHKEAYKTPKSQSNLEKEEWSWRNQPS